MRCSPLSTGSSGHVVTDTDCPSQVVADFGSKDRVAAVDGILNTAQHMREADLVLFAQFLLVCIAIGPHTSGG